MKNLFDKQNLNAFKEITKLAIAITILLLCFFRNRILPNIEFIRYIGTAITIVLIIWGLYTIISSITKLFILFESILHFGNRYSKKVIQEWSMEELCDFLIKQDIIDITIDNNGTTVKVGAKSDCTSGRYKPTVFFDKCYYIDDSEYETFDEFKEQLMMEFHDEVVKILYIE